MAEQKRFQRVMLQPLAFHEARRGLVAGRRMLDRLDQHFLAGTAFALDQNMAMPAGSRGRPGQGSAKVRVGADHGIEFEDGREFLGQRL